MDSTREEVKSRFTNDDPIKNFEARVLTEKWLTQKDMDTIRQEVITESEAAVEKARKDPFPAESDLWVDVYAEVEVSK